MTAQRPEEPRPRPEELKLLRSKPLPVFNFLVEFHESPLKPGGTSAVQLCDGAFAECTGLEATMEPKVVKEGGHNFGAHQRVGPVTFATVVLKRGMTRRRDLWKWFEITTAGGAYTYRLRATVHMRDARGQTVLSWQLENALPIKFKAADLNAKGADVGVEELHIAHEGLTFLGPSAAGGG